MKERLSIDLIICTYNNALLLKQTIAAIARLKIPAYVDWNLLVVNNNCTDLTASIVDEYIEQKIIPIKMVRETKQGISAARFCGVNSTSKDWIALIDDDCILAENWIEQAAEFIEAYPQCGLFGGRINLVFENEPPPFVHNFPFAYAGKNLGNKAKRMDAIAGAGMVVSRKALEQCGWTNNYILEDRIGDQLISGGDMEIALRVGTQYEVWYNPNCQLNHIIPERRTTKKYLRRMLFGLGASRHNVSALLWKGNYFTWLPYSVLYSFGMFGMGVFYSVAELLRQRSRAGFRIAFSPFFGWNAAMASMLLMKSVKRKMILGATSKEKKKYT